MLPICLKVRRMGWIEEKEWDLVILLRGGTLMVGNTGRLPGSFIVQPGCIIPAYSYKRIIAFGRDPTPSPQDELCSHSSLVCRSKLNLWTCDLEDEGEGSFFRRGKSCSNQKKGVKKTKDRVANCPYWYRASCIGPRSTGIFERITNTCACQIPHSFIHSWVRGLRVGGAKGPAVQISMERGEGEERRWDDAFVNNLLDLSTLLLCFGLDWGYYIWYGDQHRNQLLFPCPWNCFKNFGINRKLMFLNSDQLLCPIQALLQPFPCSHMMGRQLYICCCLFLVPILMNQRLRYMSLKFESFASKNQFCYGIGRGKTH